MLSLKRTVSSTVRLGAKRRARGKVDGNLQGSEQRLEEFDPKAETWTPIAQQVKEKAKLIR